MAKANPHSKEITTKDLLSCLGIILASTLVTLVSISIYTRVPLDMSFSVFWQSLRIRCYFNFCVNSHAISWWLVVTV